MEKQSNIKLDKGIEEEINSNNAKEIINKTVNTKLFLRKSKLNKIFFKRKILQFSSNYPFKEISDLNMNTVLPLEEIKAIFNSIDMQSSISIYQSISSLRKETSNDLKGVNSFLQSNFNIQISIFNILEKASQKQSSIEDFSSCDINIIYESLWLLGNLFCINNNPLFIQIKESNFTLILIALLYFPNEVIAYQAVFCLCNMIPEDKDFLDLMFQNGAFEKIVKMLKNKNIKKDQAIHALQFITSCINSKRPFDNIVSCLQNVSNHLQSYHNEIRFKALQIIVKISHTYDNSSKLIIQTGFLNEINDLLSHKNNDTLLLNLTLIANLAAEDHDKKNKSIFLPLFVNIIRLMKDDTSHNEIIEKAILCLINISDNEEMVNELIANDEELTNRIVALIHPRRNQNITYIILSLIHSLFMLDLQNYNKLLIYKGICVQMISILSDNTTHINSLIISACLLCKFIFIAKDSKDVISYVYKQIEVNNLKEIVDRYLTMKLDRKVLIALKQLNLAINILTDNIEKEKPI